MPEKNTVISIGGDVERAMKGEYNIDVKAILNEAWLITVKSRMSINIALLAILFFGMIVSYVVGDFFGGIDVAFSNPESLQMLNVIVTVAVWPFLAGVEMMGVLHAIRQPTQSKMVFSFLNRGSWVVLCALFTSFLISIGFALFVIPGVILAVLLSLTIPLVIEKKLSPMQAIILSIKSLRFKLIPLLVIYLILFMSLLALFFPLALLIESTLAPVGIIVLIVGLSYLAPWYYNIKGILYREVFGVFVSENAFNKSLADKSNRTFSSSDSDDSFSA